ncbi:unnamed protein product [Enterobius vermicularis]|uniref:Secreted protein n=1 Tax=Enterobius vermicularis TaxID=51028 RepID=A0A0N4V090_ENTVE|nr:unnamed protein product [Enterobius vermicularis]
MSGAWSEGLNKAAVCPACTLAAFHGSTISREVAIGFLGGRCQVHVCRGFQTQTPRDPKLSRNISLQKMSVDNGRLSNIVLSMQECSRQWCCIDAARLQPTLQAGPHLLDVPQFN